MEASEALILSQFLIRKLKIEAAATAKVLAAVPDDGVAYKPNDTNMSAGDLCKHLLGVDLWFLESVLKAEFGAPDDAPLAGLKPSELAAAYTARVPALLDEVAKLSGEHMATEVQFYSWKMPLVNYLDFCASHSIHHRGQLSVYLRPMGAKVPAIYGGSADEPMH